MREILFRAKSPTCREREWEYGWFSNAGGIPYISDLKGNFIEVNAETVCEYTGLKDSMGRFIFEGDVLLCDKNHILVIFSGGQFRAIVDTLDSYADDLTAYNKNSTIISNIHDYPYLKKRFNSQLERVASK